MSVKDFRRIQKEFDLGSITAELDKLSKKGKKDERFWYPKMDANKNSFSIIRFLPPVHKGASPLVRIMNHYIEGPGGIYNENSLRTLGMPDPVHDYQKPLWNVDKDEAKRFGARTNFISNILVLKDPGNPENENKVWLYKYGVSVFEKISEKVKPENAHEPKINVFDLLEGSNFKLKTYNKGGYITYDKSEFDTPSALYDGDEEMLGEVVSSLFPLEPFVDESQFKSYDELKRIFYKVMALEEEEDEPAPKKHSVFKGSAVKKQVEEEEEEEEEDDLPSEWSKPSQPAKKAVAKAVEEVEDEDEEELEEDETEEELEDEDEDEEQEEKPAPKAAVKKAAPQKSTPAPKATPAKKPVVKKAAPVEEDAEEEEEKPTPKKAKVKASDDVLADEDYSFFDD